MKPQRAFENRIQELEEALDPDDVCVIEAVRERGAIQLVELRKFRELTDIPYNRPWYRALTLGEAGFIRVKRERRNLMCYAVRGQP